MKMLCSVQLSPHRYKTAEGYLICKDCIIARTGKQTYLKSELGKEDDSGEEYIDVDRKPEQVFNDKTMGSFEGKPLTIEHPEESVSPENYKTLAVGNVHNVHRGKFEGKDVMYADINVYDAEAIKLIESGEMVELSCGYDCDITDGPNPEQINIRGNHVALCEQGRAGIARIQDSKSWGARAVNDSVQRGSLIQEFGRYGEQYKVVKIDGNVLYCEELVTHKNTLFKKDKENIDWAIINKSQLNDSIKDENVNMTEEQVREIFKNDPRLQWGLNFHHKNGKIYPVKERSKQQIKKGLKKYYDIDLVEDPKNKDEFKYVEGTQGISDSNGNIYAFFLDKNKSYHIFCIADYDDYIDEIRPLFRDSKVKDYSCKERLKELSLKKRKEEPLSEEEEEEYWYCKGVVESEEAERDYLNNGSKLGRSPFEDSFVIALSEESWLDENDKPTNEKSKARKFKTEEEANEYRKVYCNGKVVQIKDSEEEKFNPEKEISIIENILKGIEHGDIKESWGSLTIDFNNKRELRKAGKLLVKLYDIELFEEDPEELYIAVYDKFDKERDIELVEDSKEWFGVNIRKGQPAEDFKQYLRDRGLYFEPSENGEFVHFEVKNADEDVEAEVRAIHRHYSELGMYDSYSKKFYINAIKELEEKLQKLEKNELLDSNQKDYEIQKDKMRKIIKKQIEEYKEKLNDLE